MGHGCSAGSVGNHPHLQGGVGAFSGSGPGVTLGDRSCRSAPYLAKFTLNFVRVFVQGVGQVRLPLV